MILGFPIEAVMAAATILFIGSLVQGVVGFGFGMVTMAVLPFFFDVRFCVPFITVFSLFVNTAIMYQNRTDIDFRKFMPMVAGGLLGIPLGVFFLKTADEQLIMLTLGIVIMAYVVWSFLDWSTERDLGKVWAYVAGFFGGALGGAFNTGGPPVVMYVSGKPWSAGAVKATLQSFFVVGTVTQLSLYGLTDMLTFSMLKLNGALLISVVGGVFAGGYIAARIRQDVFRKLVLIALLILGAVYVVRSVG